MMIMVILSFIFGVFITFFTLGIVSNCKDSIPKNNVRFFVKVTKEKTPWLYIKKKSGGLELVACANGFIDFGLNPDDFTGMEEGEMREVFLNLHG